MTAKAMVLNKVQRLWRRVADDFITARALSRAGATLPSIALYPLRRRMGNARCQVDLSNGLSVIGPPAECLAFAVREIWADHCYDRGDLHVLSGQDVVDIGAGVGVFSLLAAQANPQTKIIAVEPDPHLCEFLRKNTAKGGLQNVTVFQGAVAGENREVVLYARLPMGANTIYTRDPDGSTFRPVAKCQAVTLDELFRRHDVRRCGFLKIDCEGAEYEVLLNAQGETLQKVDRIAMEYHVGFNEHRPAELVEYLGGHGFEVECLPEFEVGAGYLYATRRP